MVYQVSKHCQHCGGSFSARDWRRHHCGDYLQIVNRDGAKTAAKWEGGLLAEWMVRYAALLKSRDLPDRILPAEASVVSRGGRVMEKWAA